MKANGATVFQDPTPLNLPPSSARHAQNTGLQQVGEAIAMGTDSTAKATQIQNNGPSNSTKSIMLRLFEYVPLHKDDTCGPAV